MIEQESKTTEPWQDALHKEYSSIHRDIPFTISPQEHEQAFENAKKSLLNEAGFEVNEGEYIKHAVATYNPSPKLRLNDYILAINYISFNPLEIAKAKRLLEDLIKLRLEYEKVKDFIEQAKIDYTNIDEVKKLKKELAQRLQEESENDTPNLSVLETLNSLNNYAVYAYSEECLKQKMSIEEFNEQMNKLGSDTDYMVVKSRYVYLRRANALEEALNNSADQEAQELREFLAKHPGLTANLERYIKESKRKQWDGEDFIENDLDMYVNSLNLSQQNKLQLNELLKKIYYHTTVTRVIQNK